MPRPQKARRVCQTPRVDCFRPDGAPSGGTVTLTLDEYEALRQVDLLRRSHEECAVRMQVSRTTVSEIYESARRKLVRGIVEGLEIRIGGGSCRVCEGGACGQACEKTATKEAGGESAPRPKVEGGRPC